jgi:hypothetical protein
VTASDISIDECHTGDINWTDSSWNNDEMFLWWINTYLIPAFEGRPSLFMSDQAECHKISAVLDTPRQHDIIPSQHLPPIRSRMRSALQMPMWSVFPGPTPLFAL